MHASPFRRGLPALALACTFALALAPPSLAASWPAAGAPLEVTAPGGDWLLSRVGSWLRAVWPGGGCGSDPSGRNCGSGAGAARPQEGCGSDPNGLHCQSGAGAARPQAGCGGDPNGLHCPNGAGAARPQEGCGGDPNGHPCTSPPRGATTSGLRRGDGRR
jgi:hypothetical protein